MSMKVLTKIKVQECVCVRTPGVRNRAPLTSSVVSDIFGSAGCSLVGDYEALTCTFQCNYGDYSVCYHSTQPRSARSSHQEEDYHQPAAKHPLMGTDIVTDIITEGS